MPYKIVFMIEVQKVTPSLTSGSFEYNTDVGTVGAVEAVEAVEAEPLILVTYTTHG